MKLLRTCLLLLIILTFVNAQNKKAQNIHLTYTNTDISKQLDSTNTNKPVMVKGHLVSPGIIEQASATCFDSFSHNKICMQDVLSSMYIDTAHQLYNCVTTTVFHLQGGDITAVGMFKLPLGDTIPPDHNFPVVGGSGKYANIYGTYTRHYNNGVYSVHIKYNTR